MKFKLDKTVHENPYLDNVENYGDHYKFILSNDSREFGRLIYRRSKKTSFMEIEDNHLSIVSKTNLFSKNKVSLLTKDPDTQSIGKIERIRSNIFSKFTNSITLNDNIYLLEKTGNEISLSSLRSSARGEHSFVLSNYTMTASITLKIDIPTIQLGEPTITRPFQGAVETSEENTLLFLCAAYLIQKQFEDTSNI